MTKNLPAIADKDFTSKLFGTIRALALAGTEGATGLLASDRKNIILTTGRLFQGLINLKFLETLHNEWDDLRSKGRIKDDYQQTEQHHACLQEMLGFLDNDKPDKTRFEFIKKIFLSAATEAVEDRDSVLPQQYMSIARQMTSGDVLLLSGLYSMFTNGSYIIGNQIADVWVKDAAEHTPLGHSALVRYHEKHLMELELVSGRRGSDKSGIRPQSNNRLTSFALSLCKFIEGYENLEQDDNP